MAKYADENGVTDFLTIKDLSSYGLAGGVYTGKSLAVDLVRCQPNISPVTCSEEGEIENYMQKHILWFANIRSFIDYENVEPGIGPVKQFMKDIKLFQLSKALIERKWYAYNFVEHQISLEDSLL